MVASEADSNNFMVKRWRFTYSNTRTYMHVAEFSAGQRIASERRWRNCDRNVAETEYLNSEASPSKTRLFRRKNWLVRANHEICGKREGWS